MTATSGCASRIRSRAVVSPSRNVTGAVQMGDLVPACVHQRRVRGGDSDDDAHPWRPFIAPCPPTCPSFV